MVDVGFSKKVINPPIGMPMAGSYFEKKVKGVIDNLHVRAIAFSDTKTRALLIALDLCYVTDSFSASVKERISSECGISKDAIIMTCSHTHAGPLVDERTVKEDTLGYITELKEKICVAASEAFSDLHESRLYTARGKAEGVAFMRRYMMKDGSVVTNPPLGDPNILHPVGEQNDTVKLLKIVREGAKDIYIVGFGTHACMVGGYNVSADFPGVLTETLERAIGDIDCVFITSAQGNSNHVNIDPTPEELWLRDEDLRTDSKKRLRAHRLGQAIAGEVLKICWLAREIDSDGILFAADKILVPTNKNNDEYEESLKIKKLNDEGRDSELPYTGMALTTVVARAIRIVKMKDEPDFYTYGISAIAIGDFVFAALPGEPFVEIGNRISDACPFGEVMLACLSNAITYFPTSEDMRLGGYEAVSSKVGIGTDDIMVEGMKKIYADLYSRRKDANK